MDHRAISSFSAASYNMFAALGAADKGGNLAFNEPASNEAPAHMQASHDSVALSGMAQSILGSSAGKGGETSGSSESNYGGSVGQGDSDGDGDDDGGLGESGGMSFLISGGLTGFNAVTEGDGDGDGDSGDGDGGDGDGGD